MKVEHLSKKFDQKLLFQNLSFEINRGLLLIEGPSGCGKSTLLNIIMKKVKPDEGKIEANDNFSYAGQEDSLFFEFSLRETFKALFKKDFDQKVNDLINYFDFNSLINKKLYELSGGERQKAELIIALYKDKDIYILDEPFASLDTDSKDKLSQFLNKLKKEKIIIVVNHDITLKNLKYDYLLKFYKDKEPEFLEINKVIFDKKPAKTNHKSKKHNSLFFANLKSYFKGNGVFLTVKYIVLFALFFSFGISIAFLNLNSPADSYKVIFDNEPFSRHALTYKDGNYDDSILNDDFSNQIEILQVLSRNKESFYLVSGLAEDTFMFYKNNPENNSLSVNSNSKIIISDTSTGDKEYSINMIDEINEELEVRYNAYFFKNIFRGFDSNPNNSLLFTSSKLFDQILINGLSNFSIDNISFYDSFYFSKRSFDQYTNIYVHDDSNSNFDVKIISDSDSSSYIFAVPEIASGTSYSLNLNLNSKLTLITTNTNIQSYEISLNLYKKLLSLYESSASWDSFDNRLYLSFLENSHILNMKGLDKFNVSTLLFDYTSGFGSISTYGFAAFGVLLLTYLFFVILGSKSYEKWTNGNLNIYQNNGYLRSNFYKDTSIIYIFEYSLTLIINILLYFFVALPFVNYYEMTSIYQPNQLGYYYYSMQPANDFLDNISSPLSFNSFQSLYLIILVVFAVLIGINIAITMKQKAR